MNEDFQKKELQFLTELEQLLKALVSDYSAKKQTDFGIFELQRIKKFIERAVQSDIEFLYSDPATYLDLYCKDQDLN